MLDFIHRRFPLAWRYWILERRCRAEETRLTDTFLGALQEASTYGQDLAQKEELKRRYETAADTKHGEQMGFRIARVMLAARKWDVHVPDPPKPEETDVKDAKWERDPSVVRFRGWRLKEAVICEVRRAIRKERRETFTFSFSWIFGFLGLLIGLLSMLRGKR